LGSFEHLSLNCVRSEIDLKSPLLDFFTLGDHRVQIADGLDTVVRLLEQTLAHEGHDTFVLTDTLWDTDKRTKFGWQVNVLALLFDFKQWLVEIHNLNIVLLLEVQHHGNSFSDFSLLKLAGLRCHVILDGANLVRLVLSVSCHNDGTFEFFVNCGRDFLVCWWFSHKSLAFFFKPLCLFLNEL
jgi:hypothetical protein